ncbi:MAG TPA: DUF3536 domain-containing protein [Blastocatellia bacterium]|jgi:alpha-amylase/alpha-mannosidase (GH57 family)|nr:DUF3536 domain-containing protein [Blastocatellia bacterium]
MSRYICIHGHFYQPPRENPWLEEVELQDSSFPYHDWNQRITAECYAPNAASRILDASGRLSDIVNNYSKISFNFGPTLLSWMERHTPAVYRTIIDADRESRETFSGHGSALAQVYNHVIMPLASPRDKRTQIVWGIRDFEYRFGRKPEGMWLAETAVDLETLEALAENGIRFTILAPRQAGRVRSPGKRWRDVSGGRVDPKQPYRCNLPSGSSIDLFFYDGPISQDIAFNNLLASGERFAGRLLGAFTDTHGQNQLVHIATDGETYGHHHRHGDMALAYCIRHIESNNLAKVTVYGEYLEKFPPTQEAEILENTSWSCAHGVERWRQDCGCNTGGGEWTQAWRPPLRRALDWLRDNLEAVYERELSPYMGDPWKARDEYINVILDRSEDNVRSFLRYNGAEGLARSDEVKILCLLETQRHAMLMYTSCGWFFDEISGLEATQALRYAARAIQLCEKAGGVSFESGFIERLQAAPSNVPEFGTGAQIYERLVRPAMVDLLRVGAHYAVSSLFKDYEETATVYSYTIKRERHERREAGRQKLATGRASIRSNITWDERASSFAVLHLGDHNLVGGVRDYIGEEAFAQVTGEIGDAFERSDLPEIIRLMDKHFDSHNYSLWHLFKDEQRYVFDRIMGSALEEIEGSFRRIYDHHYPIMQVMRELRIPLPRALATPAEYTINANLRRLLESAEPELEQLQAIVGEIRKWGFAGEKTTIGFIASQKIDEMMERLSRHPEDLGLLKTIEGMLKILKAPALELDLMRAQHLHFQIARRHYISMRETAESGDAAAEEWVERFDDLGTYLQVRSA